MKYSKQNPNPKVTRFMNSYWPLPPTIRALRNVDNLREKLHPNIFARRINQKLKEHKRYINQKYSTDILEEYDDLSKQTVHLEHDEELDKKINNLVFKTGISNDNPPHTILRSRETLKSLLTYLDGIEGPKTFADLGSGDGKIAAGLALFPNSVQRVYAIDYSPESRNRFEDNLKTLKKSDQDLIKERVIPLKSNYLHSDEILKLFEETDKEGVDAMLAAYTFNGIFYHKDKVFPILKPEGKLFTYYPCPEGVSTETLERECKKQVKKLDINYKVFDHINYFIDEWIFGAEAIPINN